MAPRLPVGGPNGPDPESGSRTDDAGSDRPEPTDRSPWSEAKIRGGSKQPRSEESTRRRSSVTTRAIALAVVFLILTISYASSLRIYFAQSAEIAATQQEITERQVRIADLQTDLTRWNDPDYVQTQARARFGWVLPGETGYRVVGEDGQPLGGGEISQATKPSPPKDAWWDKLWGSVQAADQPAPAQPTTEPSQAPPITEQTKPR